MSIGIPDVLAEKLKEDSALYGATLQSLAEFEPLLTNSGTPFFPEYTDHGPKHVTEVLATASSLIRDEAWPAITASDAVVLTLAVLLHDSGMHLTEDGFLALRDSTNRTVPGWTEPSWKTLWQDFLGDALRFDARKLNSLFGDTEPANAPAADPKQWTLRDRLLIGEFIRRHHPRLAHESAIHGFPGPGGPGMKLKGISSDFADLSGLVARSHGLPIRSVLRYLDSYNVREYQGVHAPFLMALLRVADYLQVQAERAPHELLRVKRLRSPVSQREWRAHDAIRDIRNTHEDPEAIFIDAAPADVVTFLRLQRLLDGIQEELDASWAVLGEVYGRFKQLEGLGLKLRRVRSNIDEVDRFARTVSYIPCHAAFDSAGSDLLKLLIEPLYGNRPEVGIRELVQNSVDACRELSDYLAQKPEVGAPQLTAQSADVVVKLEDLGTQGHWIEVSDRGIGMTADVIRGYFLKAGASFRRSDAWRKLHEEKPNLSRVLRSGRFGIGVLAAFLLGDEVEVTTRHVSSEANEGITFHATIDTEDIELERCERPVGTTIRVRIKDAVWNTLTPRSSYDKLNSWDWFCLREPSVVRVHKDRKLEQEFTVPGPNSELEPEWRRIFHKDYRDIHWSYWANPSLCCNGIQVKSEQYDTGRKLGQVRNEPYTYDVNRPNIHLKVPSVSVFDPDGHLPLVLQRNALATDQYPFENELLNDVIRDWIASMLVSAPTRPFGDGDSAAWFKWYAGVYSGPWAYDWHSGVTPFISAPEGVLVPDPWHLQSAGAHRLVFCGGPDELLSALPTQLESKEKTLLVPVARLRGSLQFRKWIRFALCGQSDSEFSHLMQLRVLHRRMIMPKSEFERIKRGGIIAAYLLSDVSTEHVGKDWVLMQSGKCPCSSPLDFQQLSNKANLASDDVLLVEWHLQQEQPAPKGFTPLARAWNEITKLPFIPYDLAQRRRVLAPAFDRLKQYITAHEQLIAKKEQEKRKSQRPGPAPGESSGQGLDANEDLTC